MKFYVRTPIHPKSANLRNQLSAAPIEIVCPKCGVTMETETSYEIPVSSHIAACLLCILFCPLAWMPYYFGKYVVIHKCSACDAHLGRYIYNRFSSYAMDYSHFHNTSNLYRESRMSHQTILNAGIKQ